MNSRIIHNLILSVLAAALLVFFARLILSAGIDGAIQWINVYLYRPAQEALSTTLFTRLFFFAVTIILALEYFFPVHPEHRIFSIGFMQDCVWVVLGLLFEGMVVVAYTNGLKAFCTSYLSFLTIEWVQRQPVAARFAIGIILTDFLAWLQHWMKHKIPWFWHIHSIHHSQRHLNLFTDFRFHFFEYLISKVIVVVPLLALGISTPDIVVYAVFNTWLTRFYHANIKTNLGVLRYIFVTPQSHRVHHSIEKYHQDKNFGVMFSFWDRIFKTQCEDYDVYPETGIEDSSFPLEQDSSLLSLLITPLQQLVHPFVLIGKSIGRKYFRKDHGQAS